MRTDDRDEPGKTRRNPRSPHRSGHDARYDDLKLALSEELRGQRSSAGLSQEEVAKRLGSSQSRVSKMERADPTVSVDLLVRALFAAGATRQDLAAAVSPERIRPPREVQKILRELRAGFEAIYGDRLRGLYLFGSYARGEAGQGSDLDVLVVLDEVRRPWEEIERTGELVSAVSLAHGVSVSRAFLSEAEWRAADTPFARSVRREAVSA